MKPKVSLITLGVADLDRSRRFYNALGFPSPDYDPTQGIVFFHLDNGGQSGPWLAVFPVGDLAHDVGLPSDSMPTPGPHGFRGITLAHNEPDRESVDRAYAEALVAGATAVKSPTPTDWGGYSGYFADPDGHLWEIAFNPYSDLT